MFKPDKDEFIKNYKKLRSSTKMAEYYNVNPSTISRYAKKIGYKNNIIRKFNIKYDFTDDQIKYICKMYNKCTCYDLAKELNCSPDIVRYIWIKGRETKQCKTNRIYYSNFNYFEEINTEDKAYFLGFIFADGCVMERNDNTSKILSIAINKKDIEILYNFKEHLQSNNPIKQGKNDIVSLTIISNKLVDDLCKLGCTPRKTLILKDMPIINKDLLKHFIRGYFDGDGHVKLHKKKNTVFMITGQSEFLDIIKKIIENELDIKMYLQKDRRTVGLANLETRNIESILKIYKYLYDNAQNFLTRKKEEFNKIQLYYNNGYNLIEKRKRKSNTSGKVGVCQDSRNGNWISRITINKKVIRLGTFIKKDDAIKAREDAELKYLGKIIT